MFKVKLPPEWGVEPVPKSHRLLGFADYFVLWYSLGVSLLVLAAGSFLAEITLWQALLAIGVGSVAGSLLLALAGNIGSHQGVPSMVTLRASFGLRGSYLPTGLNIFQLLGFTIFEILIMARSAEVITTSLNAPSNFYLWIIFFAVVVLAMGLGGPIVVVRHWLEKFAIWIVLGTTVWLTAYVILTTNLQAILWKPGTGSMTFPVAVDLVLANPVSWMPLASDYNRFARSPREALRGTFGGFAASNAWFYALGVLIVLALQTSDIIAAMAGIGFGVVALVFLLVDEPDDAFADAYSAAVSTQNLRPKTRQKPLIIAYVAASALFAAFVPIAQYETFLLLIGALFIPVFGVVLTDYYVLKNRNWPLPIASGGGINPRAITAWAVGAVTYYLLSPLSPIFVPDFGSIGASLPSLAVSTSIYLLLSIRRTKMLRATNYT